MRTRLSRKTGMLSVQNILLQYWISICAGRQACILSRPARTRPACDRAAKRPAEWCLHRALQSRGKKWESVHQLIHNKRAQTNFGRALKSFGKEGGSIPQLLLKQEGSTQL
eukprot:1152281-Pelagomonas_calceolata.AAC.4